MVSSGVWELVQRPALPHSTGVSLREPRGSGALCPSWGVKGEWLIVRFSNSDKQSKERVRTKPNTGMEGLM